MMRAQVDLLAFVLVQIGAIAYGEIKAAGGDKVLAGLVLISTFFLARAISLWARPWIER